MLSGMSVTMILLVFFLLPLQEEETDGSEEAKETWVSGKPMRHVPFGSSLLDAPVLIEERAGSVQIRAGGEFGDRHPCEDGAGVTWWYYVFMWCNSACALKQVFPAFSYAYCQSLRVTGSVCLLFLLHEFVIGLYKIL